MNDELRCSAARAVRIWWLHPRKFSAKLQVVARCVSGLFVYPILDRASEYAPVQNSSGSFVKIGSSRHIKSQYCRMDAG
jgi:hypothetical protein